MHPDLDFPLRWIQAGPERYTFEAHLRVRSQRRR